MTPEEVWRDAREANAARYAECFRAGIRASWAGEADQAAASVIRTAMEAYAAEKVAEAKEALADIRNKPYAPWPDPDPDDTVGAMIDNQAWVMLSHIASFIGHRDGQPDLMEEWQNDWAENYPALLKDWFSPHRAAARYIADRLTVRSTYSHGGNDADT